LRADFPYGFPLRWVLGKAHDQTIRKLLARFVAVNVRNDYGGCACVIQFVDELSRLGFGRVGRWFEPSQQTGSFVAVLLQPSSSLAAILFFQKRSDKDFENMLFRRIVFRRQVRRLPPKFRQRFVLGCCLAIRVRTYDTAIQIKAFRKQCAISKPNAISSAELAARGRDFQLKLPVVMPHPLDARSLDHPIFAKQSPRLIELTADAVKQAIFVRLLSSDASIPFLCQVRMTPCL
jgi:hypothetical protein